MNTIIQKSYVDPRVCTILFANGYSDFFLSARIMRQPIISSYISNNNKKFMVVFLHAFSFYNIATTSIFTWLDRHWTCYIYEQYCPLSFPFFCSIRIIIYVRLPENCPIELKDTLIEELK